MNGVGAHFAVITAMLEDMHAVAVEGQAPGISTDEGSVLLASLRGGVEQLLRQLTDTASALR